MRYEEKSSSTRNRNFVNKTAEDFSLRLRDSFSIAQRSCPPMLYRNDRPFFKTSKLFYSHIGIVVPIADGYVVQKQGVISDQ